MTLILQAREITKHDRWNDMLRAMPAAHILQTWEWGEFKRATGGWRPTRLAFNRGAEVVALASLATRRIGPFKALYISKGPVFDYGDLALAERVLHELEARARKFGVVWLKIDPDVVAATGEPGGETDKSDATGRGFMALLQSRGWRYSDSQVQFRNTLAIDLTRSEDEILMAMSGNTRRKVRAAAKKGVTIRPAGEADLLLLYRLYQVTGERDGFLIRHFAYYERAWRDFMRAGLAHALIAEYEGRAIANVILFHFGRRCWYFYGASSNEERARMPNYALQWAAMKWAKAQGYAEYDMWGAPDVLDESDALWGVYQFKRGFRGGLIRHIGAWDFVPRPLLHYTYAKLSKRLLKVV